MPPLRTPEAIDAAGSDSPLSTDQRGFPRVFGSAADIGAVELQEILVDTLVDENDGIAVGDISLRDAIASEADIIRFDPLLDGGTIILELRELFVERALIIDASRLPAGITISGDQSSKVFYFNETHASIDSLNIVDGFSELGGGAGIAVFFGSLDIRRCAIENNTSTRGAVWIRGAEVTIDQSTISGNRSTRLSGGGVLVLLDSTVRIIRSTIAHNTASDGAGIQNHASLTIEDSTISRNIGGGIINNLSGVEEDAVVNLANTIVAGNYPTEADQITGGFNFVPLRGPSLTQGDPQLAPLGDYGGRTKTMPPLPGSVVVDFVASSASSDFATDQRGETRKVGTKVDIGAVEYQDADDLNRFFPLDWDGDGVPFGIERGLGTNFLVSDLGDSGHFSMVPARNARQLSFAITEDADAAQQSRWIVKRSNTASHLF